MKILLVNPRPKEAYSVCSPSLGLAYLSAYLKERGILEIEGLDLNVEPPEALAPAVARADLVGVYCSTKALRPALDVARAAREAGKIVVVGGPHPSVQPMEVLSDPAVDYVVLSEGEVSFHALLRALEGDEDLSSIEGIGYKAAGVPTINPKGSYVEDLDSLPFPDRDLFRFRRSRVATFCATRGCPYKCANCQPALSVQTCAFRMRSVDNVLAEIRLLLAGGKRVITFIDNDLTVRKRWMMEFCGKVLSQGLKFRWGCQGRVNTLDRELMAAMKKAGCTDVGLGIESGSQPLLDGFLSKGIRLSRATELVRESLEVGLPLHAWFIIGIPTETRDDIEATIRFALSHEFGSVGFSIGTPWPGTRFHQVCTEKGWLLAKSWEDYNEKRYSLLRTDHWGPEDIQEYRRRIIAGFREKGWCALPDDFIFWNPGWGKGPARKALIRATMPLRPVAREILRYLGYI